MKKLRNVPDPLIIHIIIMAITVLCVSLMTDLLITRRFTKAPKVACDLQTLATPEKKGLDFLAQGKE